VDVGRVAGDEVIEANDIMSLGQESFAQMRADEPGAAGDEGAHEQVLC